MVTPTLWYVQDLTHTLQEFKEDDKEEPCLKIKAKFSARHENINRALHPTIGPPNGFINPMVHP
jgi:hypothetical protein